MQIFKKYDKNDNFRLQTWNITNPHLKCLKHKVGNVMKEKHNILFFADILNSLKDYICIQFKDGDDGVGICGRFCPEPESGR